MNKEAEEVSNTLFERVYVPAFCKAAAARGVPLATGDDVQTALSTAAMLRMYGCGAAQPSAEQDARRATMYKAAAALHAATFKPEQTAPSAATVAAPFMQDPEIAKLAQKPA